MTSLRLEDARIAQATTLHLFPVSRHRALARFSSSLKNNGPLVSGSIASLKRLVVCVDGSNNERYDTALVEGAIDVSDWTAKNTPRLFLL